MPGSIKFLEPNSGMSQNVRWLFLPVLRNLWSCVHLVPLKTTFMLNTALLNEDRVWFFARSKCGVLRDLCGFGLQVQWNVLSVMLNGYSLFLAILVAKWSVFLLPTVFMYAKWGLVSLFYSSNICMKADIILTETLSMLCMFSLH
jgi:hypothetical protein